MIPQPRVLRPAWNQHGLDVLAYKRAIGRWERVRGREIIVKRFPTARYGAGAVRAVNQFKRHHDLPGDGVFGKTAYAALYPWVDAYGRTLIRAYIRRHPPETRRDRLLAEARWCLIEHEGIHWAMWRPVPLSRFRDRSLPITTDCSGAIIGMHFAAGVPDPGGNGYDGSGSTASFLASLPHIDRDDMLPGDIIVFGYYPGEHGVLYMGGGMIYTHGHEGYPDDPREMALADMESYFRGRGIYGETFLRSPA